MIHLRVDNESLNSKRRFSCGIGPDLPEGDVYFFEAESAAYRRVDCPKCREAAGWSGGAKAKKIYPQRSVPPHVGQAALNHGTN